eukprot:Colp12_sorted_trinity150504_noHs@4674
MSLAEDVSKLLKDLGFSVDRPTRLCDEISGLSVRDLMELGLTAPQAGIAKSFAAKVAATPQAAAPSVSGKRPAEEYIQGSSQHPHGREVVLRADLVDKLHSGVTGANGKVLIVAPPQSGKTDIVKQYVKRYPNALYVNCTIFSSEAEEVKKNRTEDAERNLTELVKSEILKTAVECWGQRPDICDVSDVLRKLREPRDDSVLVLDEAQVVFGVKWLWTQVKDARVIAAAVCDSPERMGGVGGVTPTELKSACRYHSQDLWFNVHETTELFRLKLAQAGIRGSVPDYTVSAIFNMVGGHVGLAASACAAFISFVKWENKVSAFTTGDLQELTMKFITNTREPLCLLRVCEGQRAYNRLERLTELWSAEVTKDTHKLHETLLRLLLEGQISVSSLNASVSRFLQEQAVCGLTEFSTLMISSPVLCSLYHEELCKVYAWNIEKCQVLVNIDAIDIVSFTLHVLG